MILAEIIKKVVRSNGDEGVPELQKVFPHSMIIWKDNHGVMIFWGSEHTTIPLQLLTAAGYIKIIHTNEVLKDRVGLPIDLDQNTLDQIEMIRVMMA
jgi:hypothetical protein